MTPEEKFDNKVWEILQKIKEEAIFTDNQEIKWKEQKYDPNHKLFAFDRGEKAVLDKLKKINAVKIKEGCSVLTKLPEITYHNYNDDEVRRLWNNGGISSHYLYIKILQPKFDEVYRLYESGGSYSENQKTIAEIDSLQSIIKPKSLELIAKEIGDMDSGSNLVEFLTNCGVKRELIECSTTKWRMVCSVLLTLASSKNKDDKRTLFQIIEGACHPLMYNGDKNLAKKTVDKFNSFLEYDNFFIKDGVLWEGWDGGGDEWIWEDKDGNRIEPNFYVILPKKMDELYVYWSELIKLAKFYFNNKEVQDDEINDIYFEIIANVEQLLNSNGCGGLKETYKKPFRNIIGCEFEIQKQGLTTDGLFANLYDFLGKITEFSLPDKNNIEKIKRDKSAFFLKIQQYIKQYLIKEGVAPGPPATKIPELKIKKSEKLSESEEIIKLSPEVYGIGINLKALLRKIWKK